MANGIQIDDADLAIIVNALGAMMHSSGQAFPSDAARARKSRASVVYRKLTQYANANGINLLLPNPTGPKDYEVREASAYRGKETHDLDEVPHTKTVAEVRSLLGRRRKKCSPDCPGWAVFDTDSERGLEIETCDECNMLQFRPMRVSDADVRELPEAQKALREAVAEQLHDNPQARRRR